MDSEVSIKDNVYNAFDVSLQISDLGRQYQQIYSILRCDLERRLQKLQENASKDEYQIISLRVRDAISKTNSIRETVEGVELPSLCKHIRETANEVSAIISDLENVEMRALNRRYSNPT